MANIPSGCVRQVRLVSEKQGQSNFILRRKDGGLVRQIEVDGCAIQSGSRCDWLIELDDRSVFVELKGCKIKDAVVQIITSVKKLHQKEKLVLCVVCSRVPSGGTDLTNTIVKLKKSFPDADVKVKGQRLVLEY